MNAPYRIPAEARRSLLRLPRPLWIGLVAVLLVATVWVVSRPAPAARGVTVTKLRGDAGGLGSMDKNAFLIDLSVSKRTDVDKVPFEKQNEVQQVVSAIWVLERDVNHDGFDGYFRYNDSNTISHAPSALRSIGAKVCGKIVEKAIQEIAPVPTTQDEREAAIDALSEAALERLSGLESDFYSYPDNLTDLLFDFVSRHLETFGPVSGEKMPRS